MSERVPEDPKDAAKTRQAILGQFYAAEYSVMMGRVSGWERLQYAAWPIAISGVAFLSQASYIDVPMRWWLALILVLAVYVAYQGTMVSMLYYVLLIERDVRQLASEVVGGTHRFWIHERVYQANFRPSAAWSPLWPPIISFGAILGVTGGLLYRYGISWANGGFAVVALCLGGMVVQWTREGARLRAQIKTECRKSTDFVVKVR